jgi:hypothetical protein
MYTHFESAGLSLILIEEVFEEIRLSLVSFIEMFVDLVNSFKDTTSISSFSTKLKLDQMRWFLRTLFHLFNY